MANHEGQYILERSFMLNPLTFNREDYAYWHEHMEIDLIVTNPEFEWNQDDFNLLHLNAMARKMVWVRGICSPKSHQPRSQNWSRIYNKERPNRMGTEAATSRELLTLKTVKLCCAQKREVVDLCLSFARPP
ncbi:hypothetical protein CR513_20139, partial [Mucuna pruriens]